ncbi:conjugal transfer protein TraD [Barnesiella intestinihominis]|uniref:conjugal transfer protein TraD n=1 Tax=Barnesiella intestinihominis TaxID=487174 RepID=UPI003967780C
MSETISMTDILLTVSVGCNLWFLFLLLYDRIMETRLVRFLRSIAGLWRSLGGTAAKPETVRETPPADTPDIIGKSRFRMAPTRTTAAIPTQEAATSEKGIELSEEEATFDDGNTETASRPAQVPEEKLDETFTSIPPEELGYGEDEPEEDASDTPRASGSSFDEIDDACKTAKNPDATQAEREKAAKVFTDMESTELYEKMMEGSSEIGIRIKGLIEIRLKKPKKEFVVPDNVEEFDIRNYV